MKYLIIVLFLIEVVMNSSVKLTRSDQCDCGKCCDLPDGGIGCCPYEDWYCCPDNLHCAPTAEACDDPWPNLL